MKILLLEDDISLNQTIKRYLELQGYEVLVAYDGQMAQDIAYEKHIDLMLLDVKVPKINGFELLKEIRKEKNTPAIFITSLNDIDSVEKGFLSGGDDYIKKPFELKELKLRVETQLKKAYGTKDSVIKIDDNLLYNLSEKILYKDKNQVALKTKEIKLLEYFLKNPNRLLKYEDIFQALWEYDQEPNPASLRTYIKSLRQVLGKDRVQTVKNVGYRFVK